MMRLFDDWLLLPQRMALHEPSGTAVIADVHLGYGRVRQRLGDAIPLSSAEDELRPLPNAAQIHDIRQLIVAGDLFERGFDAVEYQAFLDVLDRLRIRFVGLAPGNHDRCSLTAPEDLPLFPEGYDLAGWRIVHGDKPIQADRAVMGHWHPALRLKGRKRPCFMVRGSQLILPAFSLDAAGVDVSIDPRWAAWQCFGILDGQVRPCSPARRTRKARGIGRGRSNPSPPTPLP